jgi:hypothetical protein
MVSNLYKQLSELDSISFFFNSNRTGFNPIDNKIELQSINKLKQLYNSNNNCIIYFKQLFKKNFHYCSFKLMIYFFILHEYGHYYVYNNDKSLFQLDNTMREILNNKFDYTTEDYYDLPEEKYCNEFALNFIKEYYHELF